MGPAHLRSLRRPIKYAPNHILLRKIKNNVAHPVKIISIFLYLESDSLAKLVTRIMLRWQNFKSIKFKAEKNEENFSGAQKIY